MNIKKYLIGAGLAATILGGVASLALAEEMMEKKMEKNIDAMSRPKPMVVQIGPSGNTLLRGTVKTVVTDSLTVTSWGGDWIVKVSSSTKFMPGPDMTQFKEGDFVGVQGAINESTLWTVDAALVRNWTERKEMQTEMKDNRMEIKEMMKAQSPRNWEGIASNINISARSFTLTIDSVAYTINVTANAKIVNQKYLTINFTDIKDGDTVRVWGPFSETIITASVVRDVSITP